MLARGCNKMGGVECLLGDAIKWGGGVGCLLRDAIKGGELGAC